MAIIYANVIRENRALVTDLTDGTDKLVEGQFGFAYNDKVLVVRDINGDFHSIYTSDENLADVLKNISIKDPVADVGSLPSGGNSGDIAYVIAKNEYYLYNGTTWELMNDAGNLSDLGDVTITSTASGDMLMFNGTKWVNTPLTLGSIGDVEIESAIDGDLLQYDSATGEWHNERFATIFSEAEYEPDSFSIGSHWTVAFNLLIKNDSGVEWYAPSDYYNDSDAYAESDNFDATTMIFTVPTDGRYFFSAYGSFRTNSVLNIVDQEVGILRINTSDNVTWKYTTFVKVGDATTSERTPYAVSCVMELLAGEQVAFAANEPDSDIMTTYRFSGHKLAAIGENSNNLQDAYTGGRTITLDGDAPVAFSASDNFTDVMSIKTAGKADSTASTISEVGVVFSNCREDETVESRIVATAYGAGATITAENPDSGGMANMHGSSTSANINANFGIASAGANVLDNDAQLKATTSTSEIYLKAYEDTTEMTLITGDAGEALSIDGANDTISDAYSTSGASLSNTLTADSASILLVTDSLSRIYMHRSDTSNETILKTIGETDQEFSVEHTGSTSSGDLKTLVTIKNNDKIVELDPEVGLKLVSYTLPIIDGSSGQVLVTNGTGGLVWTTLSGSGGISDAPMDGTLYARRDARWEEVSSSSGGISEAPTDSEAYVRQSSSWSQTLRVEKVTALPASPDANVLYVITA